MTKKALKIWSTIFGILGVVLGLFFALQYRILEDVSISTASVKTSPNWLLGIAVLFLFVFFAVICSALSSIIPEEHVKAENTSVKAREYVSPAPAPTAPPVQKAEVANQLSASQPAKETPVDKEAVVPVQDGEGKVICPLCNTRQNEGRAICFNCKAKFVK